MTRVIAIVTLALVLTSGGSLARAQESAAEAQNKQIVLEFYEKALNGKNPERRSHISARIKLSIIRGLPMESKAFVSSSSFSDKNTLGRIQNQSTYLLMEIT
jgi:hypothetical protein